MAKFELKLPKMGEGVLEATITSWLKNIGDSIELDEAVVEIATDKVDSEITSEVSGTLKEILYNKDDIVQIGSTIAIIETDEDVDLEEDTSVGDIDEIEKLIEQTAKSIADSTSETSDYNEFYSPLVRSIAKTEGVSIKELNTIKGSGKESRVTKEDILNYIKNKQGEKAEKTEPLYPYTDNDETIELSRMGKLISNNMIESVRTSAHVQSFIEIDVTNIVKWRDRIKNDFYKREGEKLTFTPIFMQAVATTIKKHPLINITVNGDTIIKKKNVNLGMATALPDGNLIVPVIKNADRLNLIGMAKKVNDLAKRAKNNELNPSEVKNGTYTVTNIGSFGTVIGTPIIYQPQVAILAIGAIRKTPTVIESTEGDFIGIRHKMYVSHSYDHRVINGALGSMFIKTLKEILENWDMNQVI